MAFVRPMLRARPRPMRRGESASRAWTVAQKLRARRGWMLEDAAFQRSWTVRHGADSFETSAHVSFFFGAPGMVIALTPSFPKSTRAANVADALQLLRSSLGDQYDVSPLGDSIWMKVRSDKPTQLLADIAHVEHVFGQRLARRFGPSPRSQDHRRWHVTEALRASSWQLGSFGFSREMGDKQRGLGARIGVLVDSASGRPGLSATFAGWVRKPSKRWTRFCDDTASALTRDGFHIDERTASFLCATRWGAGLSSTRALKQTDVFDELIDRGADQLGS